MRKPKPLYTEEELKELSKDRSLKNRKEGRRSTEEMLYNKC